MKAQNPHFDFEVRNSAFNWRILCQVTDEQRRDAELVRQILSGDERAFDALYKRHKQRIHESIFNKIGDWHYAEELTDDTFLKAKTHLKTLREPEKVLNWMFRLANQLIAGWHRENKKKKRVPLEFFADVEVTAANRIAEDHTPYKERYEKFCEAIGQLPELEQKMLHLQFENKSYEEIAEICDVSVGSVRNRLPRAKKKLEAWAAAWKAANAEGRDLDFSEFDKGKGK